METSILSYIESSALRFPDKALFVDGGRTVTFSEMLTLSRRIGSALAPLTPPRKPVAVLMEKGADCVGAYLGALTAGCFYVPIDAKMPVERVESILRTLCPSVLITDEKNREKAVSLAPCPLLSFEEAALHQVEEETLAALRRGMTDTDLIYVLFTSGSTGVPKGVATSHRAVINFIDWMCGEYAIDEHTVLGNQAPFHFVLSFMDLYGAMKTGATAHILPHKCFLFPKLMLAYLNDHRIDTIFWVPSSLMNLANSGIFDRGRPQYLRQVLFAGEVMRVKELNLWRRVLPNARFSNLYGSTETTGICLYYDVNRDFAEGELLPIGMEGANNRVILLADGDREPAPGEPGELCTIGASQAQGYYGDMARTDAVFMQNPLNDLYPERIFRTGDLVMKNKYGEYIYVGRRDAQIKHQGYRIELGEMDAGIGAVEGVTEVCCLHDKKTDQLLCVYAGSCTEKELYAGARNRLPSYMLPERIEHVDRLPRTLNEKIDRMELQRLFLF